MDHHAGRGDMLFGRLGVRQRITKQGPRKGRLHQRKAGQDRRNRQHHQGPGNNPWALVQVRTGSLIHARLTVEHQKYQAEGVEGGNGYARKHRQVGNAGSGYARVMDCLDDRILRKEAGKGRDTSQRQAPDDRSHVSHRHVFLQPTHLAHILLMVQGDDDRAGPEEQ